MRKHGFFILLIVALQGCGERDLSPEQKANLTRLNSELAATKLEINSANQAAAEYNGGLIKAIATARVEILKTNEALIEQRILSIESGAPVKTETIVTTPDEALANSLLAEMESAKAAISAANAEASQYNGGLLKVLKLSAAATSEQTLAMLQQRYLIAKYGLSPVSLGLASPVQPPVALPSARQPKADLLPPADGPLGLAAGLSKEQIEGMTGETLVISNESQSLYTLTRPPRANDSFERYALVISPTVGLCQIRAIGKQINTNRFGHQLKASFDEMKSSLSNIYGKSKDMDFLMPGSIWKDSDDWLMGLYKKDRSLYSEWTGSPTTPLKSDLLSIGLEARSTNGDSGYYLLQYSFSNEPACDSEQLARKEKSL